MIDMTHSDPDSQMPKTFVSHLECSLTGARYEADRVHGLSEAGRPLLVRYDLAALRASISKEVLATRSDGFWRYREFLPVASAENRITLGEIVTPLVPLNRIAHRRGAAAILVKDEGRLPTGSFKARGLAVAVGMSKELGLDHLAMPTNGNAGAALAAYASRAGLKSTVLCPDDTPKVNVEEIAFQGADVYLVNGLINDCGKIVAGGVETVGWFDVSTLKEPYRIEGKKTMGLELAEQLGWELPDVVFYPTGGGTGLIGMWKAFDELGKIGWLGPRRPRMVAVQASGCAPIVRAWERGEEHAPLWENAATVASGIRVPIAVGDFLVLRALNESDGFGITVDDDEILEAQAEVAREEGLLLCPEGAATFAAWQRSLAEGRISTSDRVVLFNCAIGLKYPMPRAERRIDQERPIDWQMFRK
jgi:threonine synthase